ncbi:amidohydrolase [Streptomyces sp. PCS3-D2]|uniref:amidohydrolase n=1 Tax=Streptomyces sp. PCS3-D2 TaxID=1460244 RepID=UPI00045021C5|nr:amidohydrolase [Streptomyces sp. PCS3-D2]WKV75414.1 amidohydrolase [Streptomyces sp. PCS3-D2]
MTSMPVGGITPAHSAPDGGHAELVLRNGKIHTQDPARPSATALAVRDGRITALGDDGDIAGLVGPATRVVDALGRRVVPGLNDSHLHVIRGGLNYVLELRWDGVTSLRRALAMLREQAGRTPKGQWIRVVGSWSADQFAERRMPTPTELTAAAPDTPVFVLHLYQSAILNRAAVRAAGFTRDSPDPQGGQIVRHRDGPPNGLLLAAPSVLILYSTLAEAPALDPAERKTSTRHFLRELNRFGLTSAVDAAGGFQSFPENYATVTELARDGELSVRIGYHLFPQIAGQELADLRRWTATVRPGDGDAWLKLNGAGENLTWAAADFENFSEPRPELATGYETEFEQAVRLLTEHGWGFRLHATYDETIRRDLAVFDKLAADGLFPAGNRWLFDHAETVSEQSLERVAELGGGICVQNRMSFQGRAFAERYGAQAAAAAPPVTAMLRLGIPVGAGTDATRVSSYNPWVALHWLVTGRTVGGLALRPGDELLSREQALELYTVGGARVTGEAADKGVLAEGRFADFAVLSQDYLMVPAADIPYIESVLTVAGGRIVHAADTYEGLDEEIPPVSPAWSPVAHYGGYQTAPPPAVPGARQADLLAEAAAESEEHRRWRAARGDVPAQPAQMNDPCFGP